MKSPEDCNNPISSLQSLPTAMGIDPKERYQWRFNTAIQEGLAIQDGVSKEINIINNFINSS